MQVGGLGLVPVHLRLADAVGKAERFDPAGEVGGQTARDPEAAPEALVQQGVAECLEPVFLGVEHQQHVRFGSAPVPVGRRVRPYVAEAARAAVLGGHAGQERLREGGQQRFVVAQRAQARHGEGHLHRSRGRRRAPFGGGDGHIAQPVARGVCIGHLEQQELGLAQPAVAEAGEALDVFEVDLDRLGAGAGHRILSSHRRRARAPTGRRSSPSRRAWFSARSNAVRPG